MAEVKYVILERKSTSITRGKTIRYYLFCIHWLWKHRQWEPTRQKYKAMEKAWLKKVG